MSHLRTLSLFLILGSAVAQDTSNAWMNEGVRAFKAARYSDAVVAFQKSIDLNPSAVEPRLYLATSYMNQYIPGANSPENLQAAGNAERGFLGVLDLDPKSMTALESLASLKYLESNGTQSEADKLKLLEEARAWYLRVLEADPTRQQAHYSLGVIAWATWYPGWNAARIQLGMSPDMPGPLGNPALRADLRSRYDATLKDGIDHLNRALALDPAYDDAMAYMNLLVRESADLADSKNEYERMIAAADQWIQEALDTRREKAEQNGQPAGGAAVGVINGGGGRPEPPPEPATDPASTPSRIAVACTVVQRKLIYQPSPTYPPEAKHARIQGTVRLKAILAKDGSVLQLDFENGHPTLVQAALEAVRQWKYSPTLLNGVPIEVITSIDVNFVLDESK